jgi:hypothetical protein
MVTALNRFFAVVSGSVFVALAFAAIVWLPGAWGLLFTPGLLWLGWLLIDDVIKGADAQSTERLPEVAHSSSPESQEQTSRRLAA